MTRTLQDLQNRIAADLTRDDLTGDYLTSPIANAVGDSIRFYARERFWFNQTRLQSFNTVSGQNTYSAGDLSIIPDILRIDALYLPQNQSIYPLDRYEPDDFEVISSSMTGGGRPTGYTYSDQTILLWPIPNAVYAMRLHCFYKLPYPNLGDTTPWTDDAEELIRRHAKMLLYMDVLEDDANAQRMSTKIPALLAALRSETSARLATGLIRPTEF
jgi:hypothetical protein